jgi:hypothetical protein
MMMSFICSCRNKNQRKAIHRKGTSHHTSLFRGPSTNDMKKQDGPNKCEVRRGIPFKTQMSSCPSSQSALPCPNDLACASDYRVRNQGVAIFSLWAPLLVDPPGHGVQPRTR